MNSTHTKTDRNKVGQILLWDISTDIQLKLRILSMALDINRTKLVELLVDRLWEEKQDMVAKMSQHTINRKAKDIIKELVPK